MIGEACINCVSHWSLFAGPSAARMHVGGCLTSYIYKCTWCILMRIPGWLAYVHMEWPRPYTLCGPTTGRRMEMFVFTTNPIIKLQPQRQQIANQHASHKRGARSIPRPSARLVWAGRERASCLSRSGLSTPQPAATTTGQCNAFMLVAIYLTVLESRQRRRRRRRRRRAGAC